MVLVNGSSGTLDATDRGLAYGDGVFRTFPARGGLPVLWENHYGKLKRDCEAIGIKCPESSVLEEDMDKALSGDPECVVKIIITRGEGRRGYAFDPNIPPTRIVLTGPVPIYPDCTRGVNVHVCELKLSKQKKLAGVKHLNRLENVLARMEWTDPDVAEGLLLDDEGNVVEGVMSNVFFCKDGVLHTPNLSHCGVAGVQRERILAWAGKNSIPCETGFYSLDFLLAADEAFFVNSVIGLWPVGKIDGKKMSPGRFCEEISRFLSEEIH